MSNGLNISFKISAIDDFSGTMKNLERSTKQAFDTIGQVGQAMTIAGAALGGALGFAAKKAMDFESQMSSVKAVSGASGEEMAKLTKLAQEMGAETKYSSIEAAQGIEELIKAGVSVTDIMNGGLQGALSLATAGEIDLADAASIASTALNAFHDDGLSVIEAADLLAGAANASATSVGELRYGLSMVSAVASGVGLSFEDTTTALAVFAQNGLRGSDAGTSLKTMLMNLSPATDGAAAEMQRLGLITADGANQFYNADGSIKSLAEISGLLREKLAGLNDEQRMVALRTMFGADAIRAANILYKEGADGVAKMNKEMSKTTAAEVAAEKMNNLKGKLEELKGAFETASISIGNALLPAISWLVKALKWLVDKFNAMPPYMQKTVAILGALTAAFLLIVGPILILVAMIPNLVLGFGSIATAVGVTSGALAGIIGIAFGVVTAIIAIVVGLVVMYNKVEWFRNGVDYAWGKIKESFESLKKVAKAVFDGIVQYFKNVVDFWKAVVTGDWSKAQEIFVKTFKDAWASIKEVASVYLSEIKKVWGDEFNAIKTALINWFNEAKATITTKLSEWKTAISDWFASLPGVITAKMNEWGNTITTWFTTKKTEIIAKLTEWQVAIEQWFSSMPAVIVTKLTEWKNAMVTWTQQQNEENKRQFTAWGTAISEWFASIPTMISEKLTEWKNAFVEWFNTTKETITNKLSEWWTSISTWFSEAPGKIRTFLDGWWTNISTWFSEIPAKITAKLEEWWTAIKTWFSAVPNKPEVKDAGKKMIDKVSEGNKEKRQEFVDKLGKLIVDVVGAALALAVVALVAAGRELVKRIIDGIKQVDLTDVGRNIVRGLINGMGSMLGDVKKKAVEIATAAKNAAEKLLKIKSPSRVFMEIGAYTSEGFAIGIADQVRAIEAASQGMTSAAIPDINASKSVNVPSSTQPSNTINLTLNYNGNGSEDDAYDMIDQIARGLDDRLGLKLRLNGVR